ncbi:unnamed protein product [Caenorhabditis bovis]|uniref:RanBP2-type domain-containing protein n=1 Tax=Caenorhabditis bovis TaxID=2654633 RepID=A0A8S1EZ35_9PELO|nr:unnamed protein product [Caenorhabditis bovis]
MTDSNGGFFSKFGNLISKIRDGGSSQPSSTPERQSPQQQQQQPQQNNSPRSPPKGSSFLKDICSIDSPVRRAGSSLRYLSPSVLEKSSNDRGLIDIEVEPVSDIFSTSINSNRKRQLTETDKWLVPDNLRSESVKRSRFLTNRSLLEPNLRTTSTAAPRLDTTWSGQLSTSPSPAPSVTNVSLLSKKSSTPNGSVSSRTQGIMKRLEEANTPAKDIQRLPMIRAGLPKPERWATNTSYSSVAPPLRKVADNVPSRIQLLSKTMALSAQRKPYWRDLTRRRSDPKSTEVVNTTTSTVTQETANGTANNSVLCSLFQIEKSPPKNGTTAAPTKKHQPLLKTFDGKSVGRNTFRLDDGSDNEVEPISKNWMSKTKPLTVEKAPAKGFLDNMAFSFAAPTDVVAKKAAMTSKDASEKSEETSNESDTSSHSNASSEASNSSDSGESSDEEVEEEEETEKPAKEEAKIEESRPQTSTDTVSPAVSAQQSLNGSPNNGEQKEKKKEVEKTTTTKAAADTGNWTCDGCFTSWPNSSNECGCCGAAKGGAAPEAPPAPKKLVSNLSSFAPSKPTNVSFGFGTGASSKPADPAPPAPTATEEKKTEEPKKLPLFGNLAASAPAPAAPAPVSLAPAPAAPAPTLTTQAPAASSDRVAWDCPDCMVSNKATDDKCPCCGHVKYKDANAAPTSVFGDRAFKPTQPTGVSFGVSSKSNFSFGFGGEKKEEATAKPAPISFGTTAQPADAATKPPLFGLNAAPAASAAPSLVPAQTAAPTFSAPAQIKPAAGTQPSLFGKSSTTSLFGASKPAEAAPAPAASLFGSQPADVKKDVPLFGNTTSTLNFGTTGSLVGASKPADPAAPPVAPVLGQSVAPAAGSALPAGNLFGNFTSSAPAPLPTSSAPTSTPFGTTGALSFGSGSGSLFLKPSDPTAPAAPAPLFGKLSDSTTPASSVPQFSATPATTATNSLFSASVDSSVPLFGKPFGTDSSDGPSAKKAMFSTNPMPFGASTTATSSSATPSPFSANLFGASSTKSTPATTTPFQFGNTSATPAFGSTGSAIGGFGSIPSVQPTISNSSSTGSLFGQQPQQDTQSMFNTNSNPNFNFGGASNSSGVFKFGAAAPTAPAPTVPTGAPILFNAGSTGTESAFAYQNSQPQRKMATARRRINRK